MAPCSSTSDRSSGSNRTRSPTSTVRTFWPDRDDPGPGQPLAELRRGRDQDAAAALALAAAALLLDQQPVVQQRTGSESGALWAGTASTYPGRSTPRPRAGRQSRRRRITYTTSTRATPATTDTRTGSSDPSSRLTTPQDAVPGDLRQAPRGQPVLQRLDAAGQRGPRRLDLGLDLIRSSAAGSPRPGPSAGLRLPRRLSHGTSSCERVAP